MASYAKNDKRAGPSYRDQLEDYRKLVKQTYGIDRAIEEIAGVTFTKRTGATSKMACCPFHAEKSPSFSVNPKSGYYCCFGAGCGARGDVFQFIMDYHGVSFMEALMTAGRNAGLEPPTPDGKPVRYTSKPGPVRPRQVEDRSVHPGDLKAHGLIAIPDSIRRPKANVYAHGWHEGNVEKPADVRGYRPRMVHEYRNAAGEHLMSILRIEFEGRGDEAGKRVKVFVPFRLSELPEGATDEVITDPERRLGWLIRSVPSGHLRPVYGMERIPDWSGSGGRNVLIVEGEKTADAARRLLSSAPGGGDWLVLSPLGGGSSALHADWSDLAVALRSAGPGPIRVLVWPDADQPLKRTDGTIVDRQEKYGVEVVNGVGYALVSSGVALDQVALQRVHPVEGKKGGWDLADAEEENWSGADLLAKISEEGIRLTPGARYVELSGRVREEADDPVPFDQDDTSVDVMIHDEMMRSREKKEARMSANTSERHPDTGPLADLEDALPRPDTLDTVPGAAALEAVPQDGPDLDPRLDPAEGGVRELDPEDVIEAGQGGGRHLVHEPSVVELLNNRFFRCLGYMDGISHFMSLESCQIFAMSPAMMRPAYFLHIAPAEYWLRHFPGPADRNGVFRTDWEGVINAIVKATNRVGQYQPENQVGQGTWFDNKRIVFNSGRGLWVEGEGVMDTDAFEGEKNYIVGRYCGMPDFENPLPGDSPEAHELLRIISNLNWDPETRNVSILNLFGWIAIGVICGVLPWRPHLWLSGERGVGKSWIINKIIKRLLMDYGVNVKADSTESGLRNLLNGRAFPLIFDEAEGETVDDRQRMSKILKLARHSATPGESFVAQGVAGGGGQRQYAIASTFLMCSITPQMSASADVTRFGRAHLSRGLNHYDFIERIEEPAERLLTPEFSRRFMARMVMRAHDMDRVSDLMYRGLADFQIERRLIDVYGTYLAGAWLLLKDGVPASDAEAMKWARDTFNMFDGLMSQVDEVSEDKDHVRLFRILMSSDVKVESLSMGTRTYTIAGVIEMALGTYIYEDAVPAGEAARSLARIGIRLARHGKPVEVGEQADSLFIHKNSPPILKYLEKTPYAINYADVMSQGDRVRKMKTTRFPGLGSFRCLEVPLSILSLGEDETDGGDEQVRGE